MQSNIDAGNGIQISTLAAVLIVIVVIISTFILATCLGFEAGVEAGKQKMANMCDIMEQSAGCPAAFDCASDGCVCVGAKTVKVIE